MMRHFFFLTILVYTRFGGFRIFHIYYLLLEYITMETNYQVSTPFLLSGCCIVSKTKQSHLSLKMAWWKLTAPSNDWIDPF